MRQDQVVKVYHDIGLEDADVAILVENDVLSVAKALEHEVRRLIDRNINLSVVIDHYTLKLEAAANKNNQAQVPPEEKLLQCFFQKCFQENPKDRYKNMQEALEDLSQIHSMCK